MWEEVKTVVTFRGKAVGLLTGRKHENDFWGIGYKGVFRHSINVRLYNMQFMFIIFQSKAF